MPLCYTAAVIHICTLYMVHIVLASPSLPLALSVIHILLTALWWTFNIHNMAGLNLVFSNTINFYMYKYIVLNSSHTTYTNTHFAFKLEMKRKKHTQNLFMSYSKDILDRRKHIKTETVINLFFLFARFIEYSLFISSVLLISSFDVPSFWWINCLKRHVFHPSMKI